MSKIEEEAKAYDEAIEKAKSKIKGNKDHVLYEDDVIEIFPELAESEDVVGHLISYFKSYYGENSNARFAGLKVKDIFAWLEKQGEHANFRNKIQIGDKVTRNQDGVLVNLSQLNRVAKKDKKQGEQKPDNIDNKFIRMRETKPKDISEFLDRLTTVEQEFLWEHIAKIRELDKEEQKPIDLVAILKDYFTNTPKKQQDKDWEELKHLNNFGLELVKQKPTEWSKEDTEMFGSISSTLSMYMYNTDIPSDIREIHKKEYAWFNELYNRVFPQPKQEWSEEDKVIRNALVKLVEMKAKYNQERDEEDFPNHSDGNGMYWSGVFACLKEISFFVDHLEVKEIDLQSEIVRVWDNTSDSFLEDGWKEFEDIAKHFFELGMCVNNPITATDRGTAEEIIINLKRVEQDYRINLTKEIEWVRNQVKKGE